MLGRQATEGVLGKSRTAGLSGLGVSSESHGTGKMFQAMAGPFACSRDTQKEKVSISQSKLMR
jgi:hypothetical protein